MDYDTLAASFFLCHQDSSRLLVAFIKHWIPHLEVLNEFKWKFGYSCLLERAKGTEISSPVEFLENSKIVQPQMKKYMCSIKHSEQQYRILFCLMEDSYSAIEDTA